jgi:hypothetical protein
MIADYLGYLLGCNLQNWSEKTPVHENFDAADQSLQVLMS